MPSLHRIFHSYFFYDSDKIAPISTALLGRRMNYLKIAQDSLSVESNALLQLSQRLGEDFNQVVDLILACEGRLVIGGIGKSGLIGKKMVATFASTGTPSFFLHPTEAFHGDLGMLKPIDIVMLISYSGETDDVNKLIPSLKKFR